jgi:hypothetical protein
MSDLPTPSLPDSIVDEASLDESNYQIQHQQGYSYASPEEAIAGVETAKVISPYTLGEALKAIPTLAQFSSMLDELNKQTVSGSVQYKKEYLQVSLAEIVETINAMGVHIDANTPVREYKNYISNIVGDTTEIESIIRLINNDKTIMQLSLANQLNYCLETVRLIYNILISFGANFNTRTPFREYVAYIKSLKLIANINDCYIPIPNIRAKGDATAVFHGDIPVNCDLYVPSPSIITVASASTNAITVNLEVEGSGYVTGQGRYAPGSVVTLNAYPSENWHFVLWSDGIETASRQIVVTEDITLTAIFEMNEGE